MQTERLNDVTCLRSSTLLTTVPPRRSPLKAGGFHYLPPKEHHFAFSKASSVVQVNGDGPFDITYIDAADDPQKTTKR